MPGSSSRGKFIINQWFKSIPKRRLILDVGPGWGTYSKLLRENNQTWHAVEIHKPYVKQFSLQRYYDRIFINDIRYFKTKYIYDLIILGDVIEHMTNQQGIDILRSLATKTRYVILSLPLDEETQAPSSNNEDYWQNPHEEHKALWSNKKIIETFLTLNCEIIAMEKYEELAVYFIACGKNRYTAEHIINPLIWFAYRFTGKYKNETDRPLFKKILSHPSLNLIRQIIPNRFKKIIKSVLSF